MAKENGMSLNDMTTAANGRERQLLVGLEDMNRELTQILKTGEMYTSPAYVIHKLSDMKNRYEPDSIMNKIAVLVEEEVLWIVKTKANIFVTEMKAAVAKAQTSDGQPDSTGKQAASD